MPSPPSLPQENDALPLDPDSESRTLPVHLHPVSMVVVLVGGAAGTAVRYGVALLLPTAPRQWPMATFAVNLVGAFVLGVLLEALTRAGPDVGWRRLARLGLGTGFCGGLTTYSTFALDITKALNSHAPLLAVVYAVGTLLLGLLACFLGVSAASTRSAGSEGSPAEGRSGIAGRVRSDDGSHR